MSATQAKLAHTAQAYPGICTCIMKPTSSIVTPLDGMLVQCQVPPVFCQVTQEHNTMTLVSARTRTSLLLALTICSIK